MANFLEYKTLFENNLDLQVLQEATSSWMEANSGQVKFEDGKYVKIPTTTLSGLGDYDRAAGRYPESGAITLEYKTYEMTQDRAAMLMFDRYDVDETGYIITAANIAAEFQRTHVIPEIDAYRYSAIASKVIDAGYGVEFAPAAGTIIDRLMADIYALRDRTGLDGSNLVITLPINTFGLLARNTTLTKMFMTQQSGGNELKFEVSSIDGIPIIPVSSLRMKTEYTFYQGAGVGTQTGFEPSPGAKDINWIVCPRTAPIAVSKQAVIKLISPDGERATDSWTVSYRRYHDLWIKDNQLNTFIVSVKP